MHIKKMRALLTLLFILLASNVMSQSILIMNEECVGSAEYGPQALTNLSLPFTEVNNWASFSTALVDGTDWDLVIIDSYGNSIDGADVADVVAFINGGGAMFVAYWDLFSEPSIASALDATVVIELDPAETVNVWDAGSALFNSPNAVTGPLVPIADTCGTDGQRLEPTASGNAVAGYTAAPTADEAAIIVGNGGNTVLFGFVPGLYDTDMIPLYENAISNLLGGAPALPESVAVPTLSALGLLLMIFAMMIAGVIGFRLR